MGRCLAITYQGELSALHETQLLGELGIRDQSTTTAAAVQQDIDAVTDDLADFLAHLPLEAIGK